MSETTSKTASKTTMRLVNVVCTGNLCRSPMAEVMLRAHLEALGVSDVRVASSGTHARPGGAAMPEALAAIRGSGLDLSAHRTQRIDQQILDTSHLVLCATEAHREFLLTRFRGVDHARVRLFNEFIAKRKRSVDVDDPMGFEQGVYDLAARVIDQAMKAWAQELAASSPAR